MRSLPIERVRALAFAAFGCLIAVCVARAQQGWGGSGSASSWQAGSARTAAPSARSVASGGSSSWSAGHSSTPMHNQPGGIWNDSSTLGAASKPSATNSAVGANSPHRPLGGARAGTALSHPGAAPQKIQASSLSNASHSAGGLRPSGAARGAIGGASGLRNASARRAGAVGHEGRTGLQSASGVPASSLNSRLASPMQKRSALQSLTPNLPSENQGTGLRKSRGETKY